MAQSTRDQLLETARALFAERGFYGVSIAQIADELGLTKQALLHHFASKEKLYGEVLKGISDELAAARRRALSDDDDARVQLRRFLVGMMARSREEKERARLLMRELLDNTRRADTAGAWYLKPLLDDLIAMVKALPRWNSAADAEALALVYQLIGAANYYAISEPTLRGIFGDDAFVSLEETYVRQFGALIDAALERHPAPTG